MKRPYQGDITDKVTIFTGLDIEKTPAQGMTTMFVVGMQDQTEVAVKAITAWNNDRVEHVYLGANMSFVPDPYWRKCIDNLLYQGYWVTLDFDVKYMDDVIAMNIQHNKFIPMASVKMPNIKSLNYNACVKIDDRDFDATNPGVWVHRVHDLMSQDTFNDWSLYKNDTVIKKGN